MTTKGGIKMTTKITVLEQELLRDIAYSDHSSDGEGLKAWVEEHNFSLPMRQVRALMTTLTAKGVIGVLPPEGGLPAWIQVMPEYQRRLNDSEFALSERDTMEKWTGYEYVNIEVVA